MFEIFTTIAVAITAIISPIKPDASYVYTAKASSLNEAVLSAEKQSPIIASDEFEGENVAEDEEGGKGSSSEATASKSEGILDIQDLIKRYFPEEPLMTKIVECESQFIPTAKSKTSSAKGLLQILSGTWEHFECEGDVFNAEDNLACGKKILDGQGLSAWSESYQCWKNI